MNFEQLFGKTVLVVNVKFGPFVGPSTRQVKKPTRTAPVTWGTPISARRRRGPRGGGCGGKLSPGDRGHHRRGAAAALWGHGANQRLGRDLPVYTYIYIYICIWHPPPKKKTEKKKNQQKRQQLPLPSFHFFFKTNSIILAFGPVETT